ncbi:MAG: FAD-binding oxidoreductase [Bacteroidetes bacterium]|nr:FAD-binding oxidoreductase [Bacteroidota bacterium]
MIDYLIVGGGLAGSILADFLSKKASVQIIDQHQGKYSSKVAAGIFNPVTGRRMAKSWMVDTIGPFALNYYRSIEEQANVQLVDLKNIKRLFHNAQQRDEWLQRVEFQNLEGIIKAEIAPNADHAHFRMEHGGVETEFSWRLNTTTFLETLHAQFNGKDIIRPWTLDIEDLGIKDESLKIKDIEAKNIIFAEGYQMVNNPYWRHLPMAPNKGELLIIEAEGIQETELMQKRIFLLPLGKNRFKVGATYDREDLELKNTLEKKEWLLERLDALLKVPYKVVDQEAGIRPATRDRRPFIGQHPAHCNLFIFNGFGSKGVSQIPWCAQHFTQHLLEGKGLLQELDVRRVC